MPYKRKCKTPARTCNADVEGLVTINTQYKTPSPSVYGSQIRDDKVFSLPAILFEAQIQSGCISVSQVLLSHPLGNGNHVLLVPDAPSTSSMPNLQRLSVQSAQKRALELSPTFPSWEEGHYPLLLLGSVCLKPPNTSLGHAMPCPQSHQGPLVSPVCTDLLLMSPVGSALEQW